MSASLTHIYRQYLQLVRGQVGRILHGAADTDDIVQDVFIMYWRKYMHTPQDECPALLFRMATHAALNCLRSTRRRQVRESAFTHPTGNAVPGAAWDIQSLLRLAPREDAEVAAMYYLADMSQEEIAKTLKVTRHEVLTRLERFSKKLKREAHTHHWQLEQPHARKA